MSDQFAFSAAFRWDDDVALSATPVATCSATPELAVSHTRVAVSATADATPETPIAPGFSAVCEPTVASVATVAPRPIGDVGVAGVATVAEWRRGVEEMATASPVPEISCANWRRLVSDASSVIELWGDDAVRLGWTTLDLFGTPRNRGCRRVDCLGLVQLLKGRQIQQIDRFTALIGPYPSQQTYDRRLRAPGAVAFWEVLSAARDLSPASGQGTSRWEGAGGCALTRLPPDVPVCQPATGDRRGGWDE